VRRDLSTQKVLVTEWADGVPLDRCVALSQEARDGIARRLLKLTLRELFQLRFMQSDPNLGNFLYAPQTDRVVLLDFGAARRYEKSFVDDYLRLVWAAALRDEDALLEASFRLGFLTGHESDGMMDAHLRAGLVVGEPFA